MVNNTDGNTYAINRHLEEREQYDMQYEIDDLHDEVDRLEAQRLELVYALRQMLIEYDKVDLAYDEPLSMIDAVLAARAIIAECEADQ